MWLSWKLPAVGHYSVERAKGVDTLIFQPCGKGQRAIAWISPRWSRTGNSPLPPFVPLVARWEKDNFKFPLYHTARNNFERFRVLGISCQIRIFIFVVAIFFCSNDSNFWCVQSSITCNETVHVHVLWPVHTHTIPFQFWYCPRRFTICI